MSGDVQTGSWRAMGCAVDVVIVDGSPDLLYLARTSIDHLEQRWSRFLPESDISRLNHAAGSTVPIDPATVVLLRAMVDGWRATQGAFDPTLLAPLVGLGYAASWHDPSVVTSLPADALVRGDLERLSLDPQLNLAAVPAGSCLDPGGIGKGLAADMVVGYLIAAGARGASVSIGGDVAVRGAAPQDGGWLVGVADPMDLDIESAQLAIVLGGVATSGTLRRCWRADDGTSAPSPDRPGDGTTCTPRPRDRFRDRGGRNRCMGRGVDQGGDGSRRGDAGSSRSAGSRCPGDIRRPVDRGQRFVADLRRIRRAAARPRWR